jgi:sulfoquinovosyltransferase
MIFAAKLYAWLLKVPIVLSYHTHVPSYLPRYGIQCLVPAMWGFLRILHVTAHLTLTVSPAMVDELVTNRAVNDRKQVQVGTRAALSALSSRFKAWLDHDSGSEISVYGYG